MKSYSSLAATFARLLLVSIMLSFATSNYAQRQRPASSRSAMIAATPPMGWNSWDSFSRTLDENGIRANARWLARNLKRFGWEYVVVDEGWYLANLDARGDASHARFQMDEFGRYVPVPARFPSAGTNFSFRPLADYLHSLGLKFGLHIIRGIPREAVKKNLPIAGSNFRAAAAADTSDVCPWNAYNYGLNVTQPAAQAYYDSLARQYASWTVDFIKIDCIADHPYKGAEIRMFSEAIAKSGRQMVLSLSPGPTAFTKRAEVEKYAQMWRISDDVWDVWHSDKNFPQGVKNQFEKAALWAGVARPGHWPDADMLPLGSLRPAAGWGEPRESRLTHDEQRTLMTLWSMFRSPLIMGGNLLQADAWTTSLLTNPEVIAIDQRSKENRPALTSESLVVWTARPQTGRDYYVAVFNISDSLQPVRLAFSELGLTAGVYQLRDLWGRRNLGSAKAIEISSLPAHACVLYRVSPDGR